MREAGLGTKIPFRERILFTFERAIKRGGPEIVPWRAVWLELGLGP